MKIYLGKYAELEDKLSSNYTCFENDMLWIHFDQKPNENQIAPISHAIPDMKGIHWQWNFNGKNKTIDFSALDPSDLFDKSDRNLITNTIEFNTMDINRMLYQRFNRTSIKWLDEGSYAGVIDGLKIGLSQAIAIIPYQDELAWHWGHIAHGFAWLSHWNKSRPKVSEQDAVNPEKHFVFDVDSVLMNYVRLTQYIDGIPSIPTKDINAQNGLVFLGGYSQLSQIAENLQPVSDAYSENEFLAYYKRFQPHPSHNQAKYSFTLDKKS